MNEEEKKLEEEALKQIDAEAIKTEILTEFGFDPVEDAELIEKAVAREVKTRTFAAKAIGSKIKAREEHEAYKKDNPPKTEEKPKVPPVVEDLDKKLDEREAKFLEKIALQGLALPDPIKEEITKLANLQGITIAKAAEDPYIKFKLGEYNKEHAADDAGANRTHRSGGGSSANEDDPPNVDMGTPEGQKSWDAYKDKMRKKYPNAPL